ncbi:MAG: dihydrofolate reductase [Anaerolineae bacterium]|nr:dihydrofolate reductase [Anaerolineae bacterium]
MIISLIVAVSENNAIGKDGQVPWYLPAELQYFKRVTMGRHLIIGRKTYEAIGRPLPGREMLIVSRNPAYPAPGCKVAPSLMSALDIAMAAGEDEVFIAGGAEIYAQALPLADRMYFTRVHAEFEADVFFPPFNQVDWLVTVTEHHAADQKNHHAFTTNIMERQAQAAPPSLQ